MSQKRFVVRRIGSDYQVEPEELGSMDAEDKVTAGAGLLLAACGAVRRDTLGGLLLVGGGVLSWWGAKGRKPGRRLWRYAARTLGCCAKDGPTYPGQTAGRQQRPQDVVDEESMESFPASDAPAR